MPPQSNPDPSRAAIINTLEGAPGLILPIIREFRPENLKRRPAPGRWSAHEHMGHLAVVHSIFFSRFDMMLAHPAPKILAYNPGPEDQKGGLLEMDLGDAMARYAADRKRLVERLRALAPADWARSAQHPEYSHYTMLIMFRHLALHDSLHGYRMEELLLRPDWA